MMARNLIRLKAVIVGDADVLKTHFLMQTADCFDRDRLSTYLNVPDRMVDFMICNRVGEIAIWNTSKFIAH